MRPAYYSILQYKGGANEGKYFAFISYVDPSDPDFEIGTYAPTATSPHYILDHSAYDKSTIIVSHKG
ncbi:hypothetical protein FACS1894166_07470 [Bacilli bacterium]|nr:hypothetical protein FACS1894166_07470 [Bacilli bacterium]